MNNDRLWFRAARQKLPGLLVGMESPDGPVFDHPRAALSDAADFLVAYRMQGGKSAQAPRPSLVLIPDAKIGELLGWMRTYSEETFPLSQYCPVQAVSEWLSTSSGEEPERVEQVPQWAAASLVVGEMLAQSESDLNLSQIPLSWSNACFSLPLAQASRRKGPDDAVVRLATERLQMCGSNPRFTKRAVSTELLAPIWAIFARRDDLAGPLRETCALVVQALDPRAGRILLDAEGLSSSSAEQRVHSFDSVADLAMRTIRDRGPERASAVALLAAAALLAGGSTSHVELLRPALKDAPDSLAWFGLMAGLAGPSCWDSAWLRLAVGVERHLSRADVASDSDGGDVSWVEYEWLTSSGAVDGAYEGFTKRFLRVLTIEIVPGVTCQLRLSPGQPSRDASAQKTQASRNVYGRSNRRDGGILRTSSGNEQRDRLMAIADELAQIALGESNQASTLDAGQTPLFEEPRAAAESRLPKTRPKKQRK